MQPKPAAALISALGSSTAMSISHALRQKEEAPVGWYTMAAALRQPSTQQASLLPWPRHSWGQNSRSCHCIHILLDIPHHPGSQKTLQRPRLQRVADCAYLPSFREVSGHNGWAAAPGEEQLGITLILLGRGAKPLQAAASPPAQHVALQQVTGQHASPSHCIPLLAAVGCSADAQFQSPCQNRSTTNRWVFTKRWLKKRVL